MSDEPGTDKPDAQPGIWVTSDLDPASDDGSYRVVVSFTDDNARALSTVEEVAAYAATVIRAAVYAQYDSAVGQQLLRTGVSRDSVASTLGELRKARPPLNDRATLPLRLVPIVSRTALQPYVHLMLNGERIGEWTPDECSGHALGVWQCGAAVELDTAYSRYLRTVIGVGEREARAAVHDLAGYFTEVDPLAEGPGPR